MYMGRMLSWVVKETVYVVAIQDYPTNMRLVNMQTLQKGATVTNKSNEVESEDQQRGGLHIHMDTGSAPLPAGADLG